MVMLEDDDDLEPLGDQLYNLVTQLEGKGISRERIQGLANQSGLEGSSYGRMKYVDPIMGTLWGAVVGLGAAWVCNNICNHYDAGTLNTILYDTLSIAIPTIVGFSDGFRSRENRDRLLYDKLSQIFNKRLVEDYEKKVGEQFAQADVRTP